MKKEYCLKNNINLNCIKYDEKINYARLFQVEGITWQDYAINLEVESNGN